MSAIRLAVCAFAAALPQLHASDRLTSRPRPAAPASAPLAVGSRVTTGLGQQRLVRLPDRSAVFVRENSTLTVQADSTIDLASGEVFVETGSGKLAPTVVVRTPAREVRGRESRFGVRAADKGASVVVATGEVQVAGVDDPVRAGQQLAEGATKPAAAPRVAHLIAWTRDLRNAAPLVPASEHAGGTLVARDPDGQEVKLELRSYTIDVHLEDGFARTTIDQTFFNASEERLEGTFRFPLPPDASLSRLAMYVDGRLMEGGMAERDHARAAYERIVYEKRDPALLEWVDGSTFKMRVFPLEARQEKRLLLSYTQKLPALYGAVTYRFPAGHSLSQVKRWAFRARVKGGAALGWQCESHRLTAAKDGADLLLAADLKDARLDRDVVLTVSDPVKDEMRCDTARHDGSKYLLVRYRPELPGESAAQPKEWVVLVETSGDRDPLLMRAQIEFVRGLLSSASRQDTFVILTANTRTKATKAIRNDPAAIDEAMAEVEKAHLVGALDLGAALAQARTLLEGAKNGHLVHVGSGIGAMGEAKTSNLIDRLPKNAKYVGVGVGRRWNRPFMQAAAERTGGYVTHVNPDEPLAWRGLEVASALDAPRLLDVRFSDPAGHATFLPFGRMACQGEEVAAVARVGAGDELPRSVRVTGVLNGKEVSNEFDVSGARDGAAYLPRSWAKLEIERLLAEDAEKHRPAIVELSKAMYVMTPYTSLLVLEHEDMYTQFKVDRGRKDHWAMYPAPATIKVVREPLDGDTGDPKKGVKPSARVVRQTVLERGRSPVLQDAGLSRDAMRSRALQEFESIKARRAELARKGLNDADDVGAPAAVTGSLAREALGEDKAKAVESFTDGVSARLVLAAGSTTPAQDASPAAPVPAPPPGDRLIAVDSYLPLDLNSPTDTTARNREPGRPLPEMLAAKSLTIHSHFVDGEETAPKKYAMLALQNEARRDSPGSGSGSGEGTGPATELLYARPGYANDPRVFSDLLSYAPGLNTTSADLLAVIESESRPTAARRPGVIDPGARKLLDAARKNGWRIARIPGTDAAPGFAIFHDDADRWSWERTLPSGLHEHVVCDGTALWHLYPEIGLAAKRQLGRAHRLEFAARVAGAVPRVEDLAVGGDVKLLDARTVAVVPHHADQSKPEAQAMAARSPSLALRASTGVAKAAPHVQVRFVFAKDGRLAERHWVEMPAKKLLRKEVCPEPEIADEPTLTAEVKNLVVVPMPFRTPEHVHAKLRTAGKALNDLTFAEATELLASWVAQGNADQAKQIFQTALHRREQRQLGYYVLLAAAGVPLDSDAFDVAEEHPGDPLANYLAVHSSPVLRKHASRWAAAGNAWESGFLRRLGLGHALLQRWSGKTAGSDAERAKALAYVRDHAGTALAWALLGLVQDRVAEDRDDDTHDAWHDLARAYLLFSDTPAFADLSRYEMARCLWKAGAKDKARTRFLSLFDDSVSSGRLLRIDADFRAALLGAEKEGWGDLMRRTAKRFIDRKERGAALLLARQCWQLDDQATAQALFRMTMQGVSPKGAEGLRLYHAALAFLMQTGQLAAAQPLLDDLLKDPEHAKRPGLWRLATTLAEQREQHAAALAARKKALDLEYERQPEVINLEQVRREYSGLLDEYETLAKSLKKLNLAIPAGFRDEVVRTADRWRALDRDQESASRHCARVLRILGERELAWDYLTTPVALRPGEADVWVDLAQTLAKQGERDLADRAYQSAFERESTNAQVLWDRAENLRQAGRQEQARRLYRQLADGAWQPRFAALKEQARWAVEGR